VEAVEELADTAVTAWRTADQVEVGPAAYVEHIFTVADRYGSYPAADEIYSALSISSEVEKVGITNLSDTRLLSTEPPEIRKTASGKPRPTGRTKYELSLDVLDAQDVAEEHGLSAETVARLTKLVMGCGRTGPLGKWHPRSPIRGVHKRDRSAQLTILLAAKLSAGLPLGVFGSVAGPWPPTGTQTLKSLWEGGEVAPPLIPFPHMDLRSDQIGGGLDWIEGGENGPSASTNADLRLKNTGSAAADGDSDSENSGQFSADERTWKSSDLRRRTCENSTREAIFEHVPSAREDETVFRWCVFSLWTSWYDEHENLPVLPNEALLWMARGEAGTGEEVLEHLRGHLDIDILPHIPNRRCRLIEQDGLPRGLHDVVDEDLQTLASEYDNRVYILRGKPYTSKKVTQRRENIAEDLQQERHRAPSVGAQKTFELLNFGCGKDLRSSNLTAKMQNHTGEAYEYVRRMDIDPDISKKGDESWIEWEQRRREQIRHERRKYFLALHAIEDQHQPFYGFSEGGRTDRVFGFNRGVLDLPSEVRAILCQDFVEVDLKSAHLLIAAWLWDADEAMEKLADDDYSIWDDLIQNHYEQFFDEEPPEPGDELYETVKAAFKRAVYSTVYGMHAPSIQAQVTRDLKDILGPEAGGHFEEHPIIAELLEKRDEKLAKWDEIVRTEGAHTVVGPTGIEITIDTTIEENKRRDDQNKGVDARSAMATVAQSYEQSAMQVILEMERDREKEKSRNRFNVALWLHDGAYVRMRSERARTKDLNERLQKRCKELAAFAGKDKPMPAFFEVESIEPPELPEPNTEDTSCPSKKETGSESEKSKSTSMTAKSAPGAENRSRESRGSAASAMSTGNVRSSSDRVEEDRPARPPAGPPERVEESQPARPDLAPGADQKGPGRILSPGAKWHSTSSAPKDGDCGSRATR
jgi:hypothetical protein